MQGGMPVRWSSRSWFRPAITATVFVAGLALIVTWDLYLNPKLTETTVLVAAQPILANTTITASDLSVEKILRTDLISNAVDDAALLLGRTATEHIGPGQQFATYMISETDLLPNGVYNTYVIPKAWMFALPAVVRRGDHIDLYTVPSSSTKDVPMLPRQALLTNVRVEYALDSSGQEVINANPNLNATSAENRENSTATISELDVLLTPTQWQLLLQACAIGGQQLVISDLNG